MYILPIKGVIGENFKYTDLLMHLNAAKNDTDIYLDFDTPGGFVDEGLKISDALSKCGKKLISRNSGDVASIAVSIWLKAKREDRVFDPTKGQFLIHLPSVSAQDLPKDIQYTSQDLIEMSEGLKKITKDLIKDYSHSTGSDQTVLEGFMNENKPLTPDQIESLGFATIKHAELKAVAYYKLKDMDNKEIVEKINSFEALLNKVMGFFKPKNMMMQDASGNNLDFGETVKTPEEVVPGVMCTVDGKPAEGEYVMADGSKMTFKAGKLESITPAATDDEMKALKEENTRLKTELETSKTANDQLKTDFEKYKNDSSKQVEEINKKFTDFRNQFTKEGFKFDSPSDDPDPVRKAFKSKS